MSVEWERLGGEEVYRGRAVRVERDTIRVRAAEGWRETVYDVVRHPGAAAIVPLFEDGTVALLRQFRYPVGGEIWEIPAGTLRPGESWEACARRELEEEIGWRARSWEPLAAFYTTPGFCDEEMRVFLATDLVPGESALDEDEHLEPARLPFEEALARVESGAIRDAKTIVGLRSLAARLDR